MLNRREFMKMASVTAAATTAVSAATSTADAAVKRAPEVATWSAPWRPDSPKRLSDVTHELARRALGGEHGRALCTTLAPLTPEEREGLSNTMIYAKAAMRVAKEAPLRVLPGELVVGSATVRAAADHVTPLTEFTSVSHTTLGWERVMNEGWIGLRARIEERLTRPFDADSEGEELLRSMLMCLDAGEVWHGRYLALLDERIAGSTGDERETYQKVRATLERVPMHAPETFREAVQSLWFNYAFQRLMGTWSGIGRIDEILGSYLERDLKADRITKDEARELIAHFWVKGCEWIGAHGFGGTGDAQHYQNVILAGVNAQGKEVTNDVTYFVLDVVEELNISDFPIAVRLNRRTPKRLLKRMAEVQRHGGGIVAMYNEEVVIEGLVKFGYPVEQARRFTNDGCWETLIPGETVFSYVPFDALALLHDTLGLRAPDAPVPTFESFDALYADYIGRLKHHVEAHHGMADGWCLAPESPTPLVSMYVDDCIETARNYHNRGPKYNVLAPHAGGMANVANSLLTLKTLVYDEEFMELSEFVDVLRNDWQGQEALRRLIHKRFEFFGNDNEDADAMMERVFNDYAGLVAGCKERKGVLRPCGISTFGREIGWAGPNGGRTASPDGHHANAVLATNFSPSPGTDLHGPTAVLQSYCKMDFTRTPNGATVELKIHPDGVKGTSGVNAMVGLMKSFVRLGGMFMHVDVVDSAMLIDAQRHPEKYPNLSVRISGWSARFATMNKQWQDMVIARTQQIV